MLPVNTNHTLVYTYIHGELIFVGSQGPAMPFYHFPQLDKGKKNTTKSLWVKIRTERDHSATTIMGKTDLNQVN